MKTPVFPHMVALLVIGAVTPLLAQNPVGTLRSFDSSHRSDDLAGSADSSFSPTSALTGRFDVPTIEKAQGELPDAQPVYAAQDALTLKALPSATRNVEAVVDLGVLRNPSPYRKLVVSAKAPKPYEIVENSLQKGLERISAVYRESGRTEKSTNCSSVSLSVEQRIKLDPSKALEVVESEVSANPACACEIVKASIAATDADVSMVVSIVQTSINAAPENMRIISQCAIAAMPESIAQVQALLAKIDPNSGDAAVYSAKSAKSAKSPKAPINYVAAAAGDPLDRLYVPIMTPIIRTRPVTDVDPSTGYDY
jgi:hypothetical protein